jgi:phosphoglycolate phosphatase
MLYLFDIDGTILLTGGAGSRALNRVFRDRHDLDGAMDDVSAGGKTDPQIVTEIFVRHLGRAPTAAEIDAVIDDYVPLLRAELRRSPAFRTMPAVAEAIDYLEGRPGIHLGIATGNVRAGARAKLEHIDLWERFAFGGFGDDSAERPGLVERAIERGCAHVGARVARELVVVVGDTPLDIAAARACGVRVVAVATGAVDPETLAAAAPDAVLDTLAELPAWHERYATSSAAR